ncbi:META domain-containing protein [Sphingomonas mesophila]|uniref:META domain-containing protein n=1 Tax=Sphingomonas mesophila TaxID=2303576 RepID=UPI000E57D451|nr:META domain-containing protein [Sphingomonas mesophila]
MIRALLAMAAAALAGCATVPDQASFEASGLDGEWRIVSLNGTAIDGSMQLERGRITANFGCNLGSGRFRIAGGRLLAEPLAVTEMACPRGTAARPDPMALENIGFAILAQPMWIAGTSDNRRMRLWNERGWLLTEFLPERP